MTAPVPPKNVRFLIGGCEIPVDCLYDGWNDDDGVHMWHALLPLQMAETPIRVLMDILPAQTRVSIALERPPT